MADISEETDCAAASAESADPDDVAADVVTPSGLAPALAPPPDVGVTRAALDAVVMEKDHVHVENNLLSDHLMVPSLSCLPVDRISSFVPQWT